MTAIVVLIFLALASYRVTRLITLDDLFRSQRDWWLKRHPAESKLGALFSCPYCVGFWVSGAFLALAHLLGMVPWRARLDWIIWWALAGTQALLNALDERLSR